MCATLCSLKPAQAYIHCLPQPPIAAPGQLPQAAATATTAPDSTDAEQRPRLEQQQREQRDTQRDDFPQLQQQGKQQQQQQQQGLGQQPASAASSMPSASVGCGPLKGLLACGVSSVPDKEACSGSLEREDGIPPGDTRAMA